LGALYGPYVKHVIAAFEDASRRQTIYAWVDSQHHKFAVPATILLFSSGRRVRDCRNWQGYDCFALPGACWHQPL